MTEPTAGVRSPALHDTPTARELVEAVREFLAGSVLAATEGTVKFHTRVAINVLAMVERELALDGADVDAHRARLAALGYADDAELATAIRTGATDDRRDEVRAAVAASVVAKLRVSNPTYLEETS